MVTPRAPFVRPSPLTRCTRFLHQVIRGDAGGISGDFSDRPPAKPRVRRGSISRDSKSGGQKTRTRRDIAIGASLFRAGFSRIVRLLAPDDPGLALAATTLAAAALVLLQAHRLLLDPPLGCLRTFPLLLFSFASVTALSPSHKPPRRPPLPPSQVGSR